METTDVTDNTEMLDKWLEILAALNAPDKDVRKALTKKRSAPNRRARKAIRELRGKMREFAKELLQFERTHREAKKTKPSKKKESK